METAEQLFALEEPDQNRSAFRFRFRNRVWIRIQQRMEHQSQKIKNERPIFWENNAASYIEKRDFVEKLRAGSETGTFPRSEPEPQ